MPVPTYDKFMEAILRFLAQNPAGANAKDVHEATANLLNLSDSDKQELLPSGVQPVYKNRAGWAHDRLKRAALSSSPRRGFWQLTQNGLAFASANPKHLSAEQIAEIAMGFKHVRLKEKVDSGEVQISSFDSEALSVSVTASPDDRMGQALKELRASVIEKVLDALKQVSPSFFETIVLDLLHRMGYGTSREDLQQVGGSGDGGIDGVISLDKIGLEKVYVQAKRWQQMVGPHEVRDFYGALAQHRSKKGVFITTSGYTPQALNFVKSVDGIILIDGPKLAEFMIDHEVGVTSRVIKVPKLDSDYFDEESA